jgi:hypothetical protein
MDLGLYGLFSVLGRCAFWIWRMRPDKGSTHRFPPYPLLGCAMIALKS